MKFLFFFLSWLPGSQEPNLVFNYISCISLIISYICFLFLLPLGLGLHFLSLFLCVLISFSHTTDSLLHEAGTMTAGSSWLSSSQPFLPREGAFLKNPEKDSDLSWIMYPPFLWLEWGGYYEWQPSLELHSWSQG